MKSLPSLKVTLSVFAVFFTISQFAQAGFGYHYRTKGSLKTQLQVYHNPGSGSYLTYYLISETLCGYYSDNRRVGSDWDFGIKGDIDLGCEYPSTSVSITTSDSGSHHFQGYKTYPTDFITGTVYAAGNVGYSSWTDANGFFHQQGSI